MSGIQICGTGRCLPENIVDNNEYARIVDTSDEWIRPRTGIVTRHIADGETTWRLGERAARQADEAKAVTEAADAPAESAPVAAAPAAADADTADTADTAKGGE